MRLKLTIIYWLFATIAYGQSKTAIEFFYPDEWFGPIDKSLKWDSISYLGIYEKADTSKQSFQLLDIQLRDTLISEPAYGLLKVLAIDSIKPLFIIAGIDVNNRTEIRGINFNYLPILPANPIHYTIGRKKYTIFSTGETVRNNKGEVTSIAHYKVILRLTEGKKTIEQILYQLDSLYSWNGGGFEGGLTLRWIGDLDNDNRLDIVITTSNDYRSWEVSLLMSSRLDDEIVNEVSKYSGSAP